MSLQAAPNEVEQLCQEAEAEHYLVKQSGRQSVAVVLRQDAARQDEVQAFTHGWVLLSLMLGRQVRTGWTTKTLFVLVPHLVESHAI